MRWIKRVRFGIYSRKKVRYKWCNAATFYWYIKRSRASGKIGPDGAAIKSVMFRAERASSTVVCGLIVRDAESRRAVNKERRHVGLCLWSWKWAWLCQHRYSQIINDSTSSVAPFMAVTQSCVLVESLTEENKRDNGAQLSIDTHSYNNKSSS